MKTHAEVLSAVERIATEVVRPAAAEVDSKAKFPEAAVAALFKEGVLGTLSSKDVGGFGLGPRTAAAVVERLARECGSTAMVVTMHFSAVVVLEKLAGKELREKAAKSELVTLAFSEVGSRSQFWAPLSTATQSGNDVTLNARKGWVTSSRYAGYVWSSKPVAAQGASTLWWVPKGTAGVRVNEPFDGLGLRGNDSSGVTAEAAKIPAANMLGADGSGFDTMLGVVLPFFNVLSAATAVGLMESAVARTAAHSTGNNFQHSGTTIADLATVRAYIARMRIKTDQARTLLDDTITAMETSRADAVLRVLESKAAAGEAANDVLDLAMRVCGGAAFRKDVAVERLFRDARAGAVMAPTVDVLYDFIGKAVCGLPLF